MTSPIQTATATLHTNRGDIKIALFGNHAPKTVSNFVGLAQGTKEYSTENASGSSSGPFYDGAVFHRAIDGFMIHNNCENGDFALFDRMLGQIEERFGLLLREVDWVSLGGGIHFTGDDYPLADFAERLKRFSTRHGVQVYLEPGEAAVTKSTTLEVTGGATYGPWQRAR